MISDGILNASRNGDVSHKCVVRASYLALLNTEQLRNGSPCAEINFGIFFLKLS